MKYNGLWKKQKKDDIKFSIIGLFLCLFKGLIIWDIFSLISNPEKDAINEVRKKGEISSCRFYLRNYPNGQYSQEVKDTIFAHINRFDISAYWVLNDCAIFNEIKDSIFCRLTKLGRPICWEKILNFASPADSVVVLKKYSESVDKAYYSASQINTVDSWLHYIDIVPPKDIRDAEEHIHYLKY